MERAELIAGLRTTGCAVERGDFVFLCDPHWNPPEHAAAERLMARAAAGGIGAAEGWLCVRTGGSGGGVKFARHDENTLGAAVRGYLAHFGFARANAVNVLPLHHVSGLMAWARCAMTGGQFVAWDWKRLEAGDVPPVDFQRGPWTLSLVPTQLQRLLGSAEAGAGLVEPGPGAATPATKTGPRSASAAAGRVVAWLRRFQVIFIGGGPVWPELADAAARAELPLSLSYGMTETAAMVTALRPQEFLAGARSAGHALAHARVTVNAEGLVTIAGESVFRGYFPEERASREFVTEDLGTFDAHGHLHVHGRRDAMIITGGKKVQPTEVEAALRASGEFDEVAVIGLPDPEWGEVVTACFPKSARAPNFERAAHALAAHQRPKRWVEIPDAAWPRNAQGKIDRAALRRFASGGLL